MKLASQSFAVRLVSSAVTVAALVSACGGDDEAPDTGSEAGAAGMADGGTSAAGGSAGKGGSGATGGSSGKSGTGGTRASGGNAGSDENVGGEGAVGGTGGSGGSGEGGSGADEGGAGSGGSGLDDSGKASLAGDDGITGIASGTLFARKMNTSVELITPEYLLLEADDGAQGDWTLRIPAKVGVYSCDTQASADVANISLNNQATHDIRGTSTPSLGGGCTLEVSSIYGPIEGRFVGALVGILGAVHPVTSGYFHFSESPIGDCSKAEDPGVESDELAATMSITKIETQGSVPWKCGANGKLNATTSVAGNNPDFRFAGMFDGRNQELFISGIDGTGTFTCGVDGVKLGSGIIWGGDNGGSCTVEVTEYGDDAIVGTYVATMWNGIVAAHSTVHIEGSFRTKRLLSPL